MDYKELTRTLEEKLDLTGISQEVRDTIIIHIGDSILERTMLAITASLSEDEAGLATTYLEEGDIEKFLQLINENHPELNDKVVSISQEVIAEFIKATKE